jgi:hypothetical protein
MRQIVFALASLVGVTAATAQQAVDPARVDTAVKAAFPAAPAELQPRQVTEATLKEC